MGNTIPNKVDGTLKFTTEIAEASQDKVGKHPILAKDITTEDVATSAVIDDFEDRNDVKPVTVRRDKVKATTDIAADFDLLGKVIADLQKDVAVSGDNFVGTLKYVKGYTGFSSKTEEQEGNYVAFKVAFADPYTKLTVQKGSKDEVELDNDKTAIFIMDKHYPITVRAYNGDTAVSVKTYSTDQLVFEAEE